MYALRIEYYFGIRTIFTQNSYLIQMKTKKIEIEDKKIERFIDGMQGMFVKMQEIDNRCMKVAKDVSKREFVLLVLIGKSEGMIMREVADHLQIPMSTATGIVDKLVEKDYLSRQYSTEDRRIVKVELSHAGRKVYQLMNESMYVFCKTTLEKFSDQDQEKFISFLVTASN